jgi:RNA polymerase sigma factor (sigma-70 family)
MSNTMTIGEAIADTELVTLSLAGDRDAFGQIVSRYQSLICSLAYSATGSLGESQDLAQETFITAWNHLRLLRERHKLRAWLCGIARCLIGKTLRREGREPTHGAEALDEAESWAGHEPLPSERLMSKEEEALLWRSLTRIPQIYREPLILYYREHQSISAVADAMDLGEDAVKQRLSRGRKLLQDQVLTFIEGALERSSPGKAFTIGVLAALPVLASSASAATVGFSAVNSVATSKGSALLAFLPPLRASSQDVPPRF